MEVKTIFGLISLFIFFECMIYIVHLNGDYVRSNARLVNKENKKHIRPTFDKWIVVTTVAEDLGDIKCIDELTDWHLVLIADKKLSKSFACKNCTYLSAEAQLKLKYKIIPLIPFESYTRKIIGYLYAIENGAKYIYDTDDDYNCSSIKSNLFDYMNTTPVLVMGSKSSASVKLLNAYARFARPDIWPRDFPMQLINGINSKEYSLKLCDPIETPIIQHGLVNGDPDFEALYRIVFRKNKARTQFVLPRGVIGPFNGRNTLFHYHAFWALLMPMSERSRITDSRRGCWIQRLMHLTGNYLGYYTGAKVGEYNNSNSNFDNFLQENQFYLQWMNLVEQIHRWRCKSNTFSNCLTETTRLMAKKGYFSEIDVRLSEKWVEDLLSVGYTFPQIVYSTLHKNINSQFTKDTCRVVGGASSEFRKLESVQKHSLQRLYLFCRNFSSNVSSINPHVFSIRKSPIIPLSFSRTKTVVLIVAFNKPHFDNIPFLQTLYEPWFARVIFCGAFPDDIKHLILGHPPFDKLFITTQPRFSYVRFEKIDGGYFHYFCLPLVMDMPINEIDGYLLIGDDVLLNFWTSYDLTKIHASNTCVNSDDYWDTSAMFRLQSYLNETIFGENVFEITSSLSRETLIALNEILMIQMKCFSDIIYVPYSLKNQFGALSKLFYENGVFLEIAVPKILKVLAWNYQLPDLPGKSLWYDGKRDNPFKYYDPNDVFIHPVKLSQLSDANFRKDLCDNYVIALFNATGII